MSDKKQKKKIDPLDVVFGVACLLVMAVLLAYWLNFKGHPISAEVDNWGVFGDYVGGLINPILGFFSFMALLITLDLQRKQLNKSEEQLELNREELRLTREELKKAADAQIDSAKVMDEQLKTQFLQQFDSLFFNLLGKLSQKLDELEKNKVLDDFCKLVQQPSMANSLNNHRSQQQLLDLIFEILNILHTRFDDTNYFLEIEKQNFKKKYRNIILCLIPEKVLYLIVKSNFDGSHNSNDFRNKDLVEKFSLFEFMSFNGNFTPIQQSFIFYHLVKFKEQAFLNNFSYEVFKKNIVFQILTNYWKSNHFIDLINIIYDYFLRSFKSYISSTENNFYIPKESFIDSKFVDSDLQRIIFHFKISKTNWYAEMYCNGYPLKKIYLSLDNELVLIFERDSRSDQQPVSLNLRFHLMDDHIHLRSFSKVKLERENEYI